MVQDQDLSFKEVDLISLKCSCTIFAHQGQCTHLDIASDIYLFKGKKFRFLYYSSLHKEIRHGSLELGTQWAQIVEIISGEMGLIKYCSKIVFEECRNTRLHYDLLSKSRSGLEMAQDLIRSRKKWELRCLPNHLANWLDGYQSYLRMPEVTRRNFLNLSTPSEAYRVWFYYKKNKEARHELKELLLEGHKNNKLLLTFLNQAGNSSYEYMVALELSMNLLDLSETNQLKENSKITGPRFIPRFERYVHDPHTFDGKRLIKKNIDKFINDENLEKAGLDLRYSGLICSSYKRELAFKKGLDDWEWDQVKIDKDRLKIVMSLEKFFYPSLFNQALKK